MVRLSVRARKRLDQRVDDLVVPQCTAPSDPEQLRTLVWGGAPMYVEDAMK